MSKNFYIIVPYTPAVLEASKAASKKGFFSIFSRSSQNVEAEALAQKNRDFQEQRLQLEQRINTVIAGLSGLGLKSIPLKTEEIIELFYNSYNLDAGPLIDAGKLSEIKISN